jgi:hypothetical protein
MRVKATNTHLGQPLNLLLVTLHNNICDRVVISSHHLHLELHSSRDARAKTTSGLQKRHAYDTSSTTASTNPKQKGKRWQVQLHDVDCVLPRAEWCCLGVVS